MLSGLLVTPRCSCVSALPCLALPCLDLLKTVMLSYILISVFLVPPRCVHRDIIIITRDFCSRYRVPISCHGDRPITMPILMLQALYNICKQCYINNHKNYSLYSEHFNIPLKWGLCITLCKNKAE